MSIAAATAGIRGASLLAFGRPEGLLIIAAQRGGAWLGFWALPITIVLVAGFRLVLWGRGGILAHAVVPLTRDMLTFTIGWLGFALITHRLCLSLGRGVRWPAYIAAWNWSNLIGNVLLIGGTVPGLLGAPHVVDQAGQLVAIGWALWLEWFVTCLALGLSPLTAALFVLLDETIGPVLAMCGALLGSGVG